jgi:hypothetical protein
VVAIAVGPVLLLLLLLLVVAATAGVRQLWHGVTTTAAARVRLLTAVVGPVIKRRKLSIKRLPMLRIRKLRICNILNDPNSHSRLIVMTF